MSRLRYVVALGAFAALFAGPAGAMTETASAADMQPPAPTQEESTLTWHFTSAYPDPIEVVFFAQDDDAVWPADGTSYEIRTSQEPTMTLACRYGELICYGAWVDRQPEIVWGVGKDGTAPCSDCCATCGYGDVRPIGFRP